jgi:acetyltransferase-like isoleucine patch superfamily enzyme
MGCGVAVFEGVLAGERLALRLAAAAARRVAFEASGAVAGRGAVVARGAVVGRGAVAGRGVVVARGAVVGKGWRPGEVGRDPGAFFFIRDYEPERLTVGQRYFCWSGK